MFKITTAASDQVRAAAKQGGTEGMALRMAAYQKADGTVDYHMGFDEANEEDIHITTEGVEILMKPEVVPVLDEAVMDYVELKEGEFSFIFLNPIDANYSPPVEERKRST